MTRFVLLYASASYRGTHNKWAIQHKDKVFKVALPDRWLVAINGPKLVDEVQKMPDTKMSFQEAVGDVSIYLLPLEDVDTERV